MIPLSHDDAYSIYRYVSFVNEGNQLNSLGGKSLSAASIYSLVITHFAYHTRKSPKI